MPERPLLLFPTPQPADRTKQKPQFGRVHKPNVTRQGQRLSPMFNQLQAAFEARRVELQQNTVGIDPEQVRKLSMKMRHIPNKFSVAPDQLEPAY